MKKNVIAALLAFTLAVGCITPLSVSAEEQASVTAENAVSDNGAATIVEQGSCGDTANYTLDVNGVLTISGSGAIKIRAFENEAGTDSRVIKQIVISSGITEIPLYAFLLCDQVESVEIPNTVETIGDSAFEACRSLKSVEIPSSVKSIGTGAFSFCSSLESITVDTENTVYESPQGSNALIEKSTKTLVAGCKNTVIPEDTKKLKAFSFAGCTGLTSIVIPKKISSVGFNVFDSCTNLNSITVDEANSNYESKGCNAIIYKSNQALIEGCNTTVIPEGIKSIRRSAFSGREGLQSITIPSSVMTINNDGDNDAAGVFDGCSNLEEITVAEDNTVYDSRDNCNAIIKKATDTDSVDTLVLGCSKTVIPTSVVAIGEEAFAGCVKLTSISIPESVLGIYEGAFAGCTGLTTVSMQKTLQLVDYAAFYGCSNLNKVTFCGTEAEWNEVLMSDEDRAQLVGIIQYHNLVKTEEIPATCTAEGTAAYWTCSVCSKSYQTEDVARNPQEITKSAKIPMKGHQYTLKKSDAKYLAAVATCTEPAKYYYSCVCGKSAADKTKTFAFGKAAGHSWDGGTVTKEPTTKAEGVKTYTCKKCKAAKTEPIAKLKTTTNNNNNNNNNAVKKGTKITIKGYKYTVKNSSEVTFTGVKNKKAKKISIPAKVKIKNKNYKVTAMSAKSLKGVKAKNIIVGNNVKTIGNSAMENCKKLTNVTLGKNVKKIGKNAFKSDKKLKQITIKSTKLKSVGKNAFKGINSKAKITVPKKKYSNYKKLMKGKGQSKKVKIVKAK